MFGQYFFKAKETTETTETTLCTQHYNTTAEHALLQQRAVRTKTPPIFMRLSALEFDFQVTQCLQTQ